MSAAFTVYRRYGDGFAHIDASELVAGIREGELQAGAPVVVVFEEGGPAPLFGVVAWASSDGTELTVTDVDEPNVRRKFDTSRVETLYRLNR